MFNLIHSKTGKIKKIKDDIKQVIRDLYSNEYILKDEKLKKVLSEYKEIIPLYNPYVKEIILVLYNNVYDEIINKNNRFPNEKIIDQLKQKEKDLIKSKNDDEHLKEIQCNLIFINYYDIDILKTTFLTIIHETNPVFMNITDCERKSYLIYQQDDKKKLINPYYTNKELQILKKAYNIVDSKNNLCESVNKYDIDNKVLLYHQIFLTHNNLKQYIQYYSLFGSYYFNDYMRNKFFKKDVDLENQIINMYNIIKMAPEFDKDYILFRYITNDNYLSALVIGDIFCETSFVSTSRNPFLDFVYNIESVILIKIKIPKNIRGIGLSIESYSLFPYENEIIINPCYLKLIKKITRKEENIYFHTKDEITSAINTIYEFTYVKPYDVKIHFSQYQIYDHTLLYIDFYKIKLNSNNEFNESIIRNFYHMINLYNNRRLFQTTINNTIYTLNLQKCTDTKYFYLKNDKNIFMYYINDITGGIEFIFVIGEVMSINYLHRYNGISCHLDDKQILDFCSPVAFYFKIETIIIHSNYNSYYNIKSKLEDKSSHDNINELSNKYIKKYIANKYYYSLDFINYIEKGIKRFNNRSITQGIFYFKIDKLMKENPTNFILNNMFLNKILSLYKFKTLQELYLFLHYNDPLYINELNKNIRKKTGLKQIQYMKQFYIINTNLYMYGNKKINYIPFQNK